MRSRPTASRPKPPLLAVYKDGSGQYIWPRIWKPEHCSTTTAAIGVPSGLGDAAIASAHHLLDGLFIHLRSPLAGPGQGTQQAVDVADSGINSFAEGAQHGAAAAFASRNLASDPSPYTVLVP